jgi:hypothetical protein
MPTVTFANPAGMPPPAARDSMAAEVARALAGNDEKQWRLLMHPIREAALALAREGRITILRKGKPFDPATVPKGVIRLSARG